jgi:hypothetical protein
MPGSTYNPATLDERCLCGRLLARRTPLGIEILCRRCKRVHLVRWLDWIGEDDETAPFADELEDSLMRN